MILIKFILYKRFKWTQLWIFDQKPWGCWNKKFNDPEAFIECSNTMDDVYENIDNYNPRRKTKILIVFDDIIADVMTDKKFKAIIKELLDAEKWIFHLRLSLSLIFLFQKMSD